MKKDPSTSSVGLVKSVPSRNSVLMTSLPEAPFYVWNVVLLVIHAAKPVKTPVCLYTMPKRECCRKQYEINRIISTRP